MLIRIWDWLFRRYTYEVIEKCNLWSSSSSKYPLGVEYILKRNDGMLVRRRFY